MDYELMMNGNVKIGQKAPDFSAITTINNFSLKNFQKKWLILFSYPCDFTKISATQLINFESYYSYFKKLNTEILALSIGSVPSHLAFINNIFINTSIQISFPIIADRNGEIARKYGMISNDINAIETTINAYIIDTNNIIQSIFIYPPTIPIPPAELLKIVQTLQKI